MLKTYHASVADIAACRQLLRTGSRSFYAASFLLPQRIRDPAIALYAFCRIADDAIDCAGDEPGAQARALDELRDRLGRVYDGRPIDAYTDRALADVVERFGIPKALLDALLEGFEWTRRVGVSRISQASTTTPPGSRAPSAP
jgi:15-cis-phytoene synthase